MLISFVQPRGNSLVEQCCKARKAIQPDSMFFLFVQLSCWFFMLPLITFTVLYNHWFPGILGKKKLRGWDFWRSFCLTSCTNQGYLQLHIVLSSLENPQGWKIPRLSYHLLWCLTVFCGEEFFHKVQAEFWTNCDLWLSGFVVSLCPYDKGLL